MSALQTEITRDLEGHPRSTAAEIAMRIGRDSRAVRTSLTHLRGSGIVEDGSTATAIGPGAFAHTDTEHPVRWTLRPIVYFDDRARNGKGAWRAVTRSGATVDCPTFRTEAEARESVGLEGGNANPAYRPTE